MLAEKRTTGNMRHVQLAGAIGSVLPDGGACALFGLRSSGRPVKRSDIRHFVVCHSSDQFRNSCIIIE
ncbi:hypothetical protein DK749_21300 [Salmonella enterica subsp. salamae]|nr:hypothetical protein LFZ92_21830 [Salmonella enterica subsp. salamae serovar 57:z29:z42]EAA7840923.1 hypothetical protein [Salmonella enterica]EAU0240040.1 hypothetical protein [Salmonella enterica]ECE5745237.1 hypothetical protein [Salmonella enterica subsp. salamae]ECI4646802.1 hypothetical protein [Salmonella enterica subsp. salamae]